MSEYWRNMALATYSAVHKMSEYWRNLSLSPTEAYSESMKSYCTPPNATTDGRSTYVIQDRWRLNADLSS